MGPTNKDNVSNIVTTTVNSFFILLVPPLHLTGMDHIVTYSQGKVHIILYESFLTQYDKLFDDALFGNVHLAGRQTPLGGDVCPLTTL